MFLESYLKGGVALNFVVLKVKFKGLEPYFARFFMIL